MATVVYKPNKWKDVGAALGGASQQFQNIQRDRDRQTSRDRQLSLSENRFELEQEEAAAQEAERMIKFQSQVRRSPAGSDMRALGVKLGESQFKWGPEVSAGLMQAGQEFTTDQLITMAGSNVPSMQSFGKSGLGIGGTGTGNFEPPRQTPPQLKASIVSSTKRIRDANDAEMDKLLAGSPPNVAYTKRKDVHDTKAGIWSIEESREFPKKQPGQFTAVWKGKGHYLPEDQRTAFRNLKDQDKWITRVGGAQEADRSGELAQLIVENGMPDMLAIPNWQKKASLPLAAAIIKYFKTGRSVLSDQKADKKTTNPQTDIPKDMNALPKAKSSKKPSFWGQLSAKKKKEYMKALDEGYDASQLEQHFRNKGWIK